MSVAVDATDVAHRIFDVRERIPVQHAGSVTLLYPRWEAASHGPSLNVADLFGLEISGNGRPLRWRRDPVEPHAFHIDVPAGIQALDVSYQVSSSADRLSADFVAVGWQHLVLYPAGWFARNIQVTPSLRLPAGLHAFTSLEPAGRAKDELRLAPVSLETLLDSPVMAGRYVNRVPLYDAKSRGVTLDLLATRPGDLDVPPARVEELRRMVAQTAKVFGAAPFERFEIVGRMTDDASSGGSEHRASSEISMASSYFRGWDEQLHNRDIIPHEFVHAWNGLFRVPADLWSPTPNVPQGGSLLWVYEGQTEFWGRILAARSGLRTLQETLDKLALDAADVSNRPGRAWRPLSDDVNYPSFMLGRRVSWRDQQRRKDYYVEGVLLWLNVDAIVRERSGGRRSIDDFAHGFYGGASPHSPARTYTFESLCAALNDVAAADWVSILRAWVDGHSEVRTNEGLERLGWRLVYTDEPTDTFRQNELDLGGIDLSYSVGLTVSKKGLVRSVSWNGPAFRAGLAPGMEITEVAGQPFTADALLEAVRLSKTGPVELRWKSEDLTVAGVLNYSDGLRYPRLKRIEGRPDLLKQLLAPR